MGNGRRVVSEDERGRSDSLSLGGKRPDVKAQEGAGKREGEPQAVGKAWITRPLLHRKEGPRCQQSFPFLDVTGKNNLTWAIRRRGKNRKLCGPGKRFCKERSLWICNHLKKETSGNVCARMT